MNRRSQKTEHRSQNEEAENRFCFYSVSCLLDSEFRFPSSLIPPPSSLESYDRVGPAFDVDGVNEADVF